MINTTCTIALFRRFDCVTPLDVCGEAAAAAAAQVLADALWALTRPTKDTKLATRMKSGCKRSRYCPSDATQPLPVPKTRTIRLRVCRWRNLDSASQGHDFPD